MKLLKMMFYSRGVLFMPYVYAFGSIILLWTCIIIKVTAPLGHEFKVNLSDTLILGLWGGQIALMGVASWGRSKNQNPKWDGITRREEDEKLP